MPPVHVGVSTGQTLPHVPQLFGSVCRSTHDEVQHVLPPPHALPQAPQLLLSEVVFLHAEPQHVGVPPLHAAKQAPQF